MIRHRSIFEDETDVARHGTNDESEVIPMITERFVNHVRLNPECAPYRCEHGSYVGFQRTLAYRCKFCPEE